MRRMRPISIVEVQVLPQALAGMGHALVGFEINLLVFDRLPQTLDKHVIPPTALAVHRDGKPVGLEHLRERLAGELGGFNRSSQHLQPGGVYGATRGMDEAIDGKRCDALSGGSLTSA